MRSAIIGSPFLFLVLFFEACGGDSGAPPPAPAGLKATAVNAQVSLTWNASSGAASYNLYRSANDGAPTRLNTSPATASYTDTGLTYGTPYCYQVTAVNSSGESAKSSAACATPKLPDIVFASTRALDGSDAANTNSAQNIWTVNADGTNAVPLTRLTAQAVCPPGSVGCYAPPDGLFSKHPAWAPDKTKIAFISDRAEDGSDGLDGLNSSGLWTIDVDGSHLVPLVFVGGFDPIHDYIQEPAWSPDGMKLSVLWTYGLSYYANVALVNADGSIFPTAGVDIVVLTSIFGGPPTAGTSSGRWSPDGSKLIFDAPSPSFGDLSAPATAQNIWVVNADGSHQTDLTNLTNLNAGSFDPNWSPDGSEVAFSSSRALDGSDAANANGTVNIWVMRADGTGATPLTKLTAAGADCRLGIPITVTRYERATTAAAAPWSPDGTKLALECARSLDGRDAANANLTVNIWVMKVDGTGATPLTNLTAAGASSHNAAWSPDGSKLVFESFRAIDGSDLANAASNIWVMNSDGSGATPLTKNTTKGADSVQPKWRP